jgi:hypothetical protein
MNAKAAAANTGPAFTRPPQRDS